MNIRTFEDFKEYVSAHGCKRCLVRCDLNLPSDVEDLSRVYAINDTVLSVLDMGLQVILISHYKRPKIDDIPNPKFSLRNIVDSVSKVLGKSVSFVRSSIFDIEPKDVDSPLTLFENLRFYEGETKDDDELAERLSKFGDVYINDAFSVSHRAHASIRAITKYLPSFAGKSLQNEIEGISKVTDNVARPLLAIIGGSKVSSKIGVLKQLSQTADYLVVAGAMANTFLAARGVDMKQSMVETDQLAIAREIEANSKAEIILPTDFLVSRDINENGVNCDLDEIPSDCGCFDIGEQTVKQILDIINRSTTLIWNGALGAFEFANFNKSSDIVTRHIAEKTQHGQLISVIGGGETIASIGDYKSAMTFVSTAGGAFLEFIAGDNLPGIDALRK